MEEALAPPPIGADVLDAVSRQQVQDYIARQFLYAHTRQYGTRRTDLAHAGEAEKVKARRQLELVVPRPGAAALLVRR